MILYNCNIARVAGQVNLPQQNRIVELRHIDDRQTIAFDAPGVGHSPATLYPHTMRGVARIVAGTRPVPMRFVGLADVYTDSGEPDDLLAKYGMTATDIRICKPQRWDPI